MTLSEIEKWLKEQVPEEEIELLDDTDPKSAYMPIWVIETLLDRLTMGNWNRLNHKYSFHPDTMGVEWLATSHELELLYDGVRRVLICTSFINPNQFLDTRNLMQTGIAEATKAGVKVLGSRFGKGLNDRMVLKTKPKRQKIKVTPDAKVMKAYMEAVAENDTEKINNLLSHYDIKTDKDHAA